MAWVTALVGLVGAYAASQGNDGSNTSRVGGTAEQRSGELWNSYRQNVMPRQRQVLDQAFDQGLSPTAEAGRAGAEAQQTANNENAITLRNAGRAGINVQSPAYLGIMRDQQAKDTGLVAAARTAGRRYATQTNLNNEMNAVSMGNSLLGGANTNLGLGAELAPKVDAFNAGKAANEGEAYGSAVAGLSNAVKKYNSTPKQVSTNDIPQSMSVGTGLSDAYGTNQNANEDYSGYSRVA